MASVMMRSPKLFADFGHDFQGFDAEALECVGRGARLVGAAAEELRAGAATRSAMAKACSRLSMEHGPATMARSRPPMVASVPGKRMTVSSSFTSRLASLYGLRDADDFGDAGQLFEVAAVDFALVAGDADGGALGSGEGVGAKTQLLNMLADGLNLFRRGLRLHDD